MGAAGKAAGVCVAGAVSYTAAGEGCAAKKDAKGKDVWDWTLTAGKCTAVGKVSYKCLANCTAEEAAIKAAAAGNKSNASNASANKTASNASANNASEASAAGGLAATAVVAVLAV